MASRSLVSVTMRVMLPWKRPAFESMEMERSSMFFSLEMSEVMLATS